MAVQLAPRPKNEDRRVVAVKRTGIIDSDQSENFSVFCELAKELTNFDYIAFSLFDENSNAKSPPQMELITKKMNVRNSTCVHTYF